MSKAKPQSEVTLGVRAVAIGAGVLGVLALAEGGWVWLGYRPVLYCSGRAVLHWSGLSGWYVFMTYAAMFMAVLDGCARGFRHTIRWLLLVVLLVALPGWLEAGLSRGRACG